MFDRDEKPDLNGMTEDEAFEACMEFVDYVYNVADDVSEERFDSMIQAAKDLYAEYYELWG